MTTLARAQNPPIEWDQWIPAIALPCACVVADFTTGEHVFRIAPAALISVAALGIAAFVLCRLRGAGAAGLIAIGPIWLCGAVAASVGFVLTILAVLGALAAIPLMPLIGLHIWPLLPLAVLATTPVCTGAAYLLRANELTRALAAAHGKPATIAAALAGGLAAGAIVVGAEIADRRWVDARIEALQTSSAETWPATLASLNAYPLCGRERCKQRVCSALFRQFGETPAGGLVTAPDTPARHDAAFLKAFGASTGDACKRYD